MAVTQAQVIAWKKARTNGLKEGWRSGLEVQESARLTSLGAVFEYEPFRIPFVPPAKIRHYTPDFLLANGIIVETKGRFKTEDRQKHIAIKLTHPMLDIRFVFSNARQRISKTSKTSYGDWCDMKGFLFAHKQTPEAWLTEPQHLTALAAIKIIRAGDKT